MSILSQLAVTQAAALSVSTLGRIDYFTDSADGKLKEYDQTNTLKDVGGSSIAGDVAYTLTVPANWDGSPATAQAALDELASRIKNIEDTRPYTVTNDLVIFDRDIQIPQNSLFVGDAIKLSDLAQSLGYQTAYDQKEYIILSYEITANESKRPKAKVFGAPSAFDLQPLDSVQQSFTSVLVANIQSLQQVIGKTYSLKASCDQDLLVEVFRIGEGSGVDTLIVNETIPAAQTNINGFDFDLIPLVDFENMKNYRIEFTPLNGGTLQIKGGIISSIFVPYIRRQVGWVYVNKDLSFLEDLDTKEDSFSKNTAFNKNFGTASGDVLEGDTRTINAGEITTLSNTSGTNTGDETAATIKTKYESNTNTNAFTDSEKTNLSNQSGTNTGDETTTSVQTKRPIKTVNGQSLEGSGNVAITASAPINSASFMSSITQNVGTLLNGIGTNIQINLTNILGPNTLGYGISSGSVTIPAAGWYKVSLKGAINTTSNNRQNTSFVVKRNLVNIAGTFISLYTRNNSNDDGSASASNIIPQFQFSLGDTIGFYAITKGDNSQTSFTVPQECILTLEFLG